MEHRATPAILSPSQAARQQVGSAVARKLSNVHLWVKAASAYESTTVIQTAR
jgi:hypothetical protein